MTAVIAEVTAESTVLMNTSSMLPELMVFLFLLSAATVVIAGLLWLVLAILKRRAPRARIAAAVATLGFGLLLYPVFGTGLAIASVQPPVIWLMAGPALLSVALGMMGIAWIARYWRLDDPNRCADCEHSLVDAQDVCPECGAPRTKRRSHLQRRVLAITILAFVSGLVGFLALRTLGSTVLPWAARLSIGIEDSAGTTIVKGDAEAIVRAQTIWWTIEDGYGEKGGLVAVHSATMQGAAGAASVTVLPSLGTAVDDAWFEGVARDVASWKPECSSAALAWARTMDRRLKGEPAKYGSAAPNVSTFVRLDRPMGLALPAVVAAGPLAALLAAPVVLWWLRRFPGR